MIQLWAAPHGCIESGWCNKVVVLAAGAPYRASIGAGKERGIFFAPRFPQQQQRQFTDVVIAPHGTLSVRHLLARRNVVPPIGTMIDRVQQQTLVFGIAGEVWRSEEHTSELQSL